MRHKPVKSSVVWRLRLELAVIGLLGMGANVYTFVLSPPRWIDRVVAIGSLLLCVELLYLAAKLPAVAARQAWRAQWPYALAALGMVVDVGVQLFSGGSGMQVALGVVVLGIVLHEWALIRQLVSFGQGPSTDSSVNTT